MKPLSVKESRETIVLDFDGVLHDYSEWTGPVPEGSPVEGSREFVNWLLDRNYKLYIISARASHENGPEAIRTWLRKWNFPPITVGCEKVGGALYLDDRGMRFEGDFGPVYEYLQLNPKPGRWGLKDGNNS